MLAPILLFYVKLENKVVRRLEILIKTVAIF